MEGSGSQKQTPNTGTYDPVSLETDVAERWRKDKTFENSIEQRRESQPFTFLEGPPTANGKPGIHHVLSRLYKDMVCRWKTMEGHLVERKGGWDTHGLPVEIEVQKQLNLMSNEEIEAYGISCSESASTSNFFCPLTHCIPFRASRKTLSLALAVFTASLISASVKAPFIPF